MYYLDQFQTGYLMEIVLVLIVDDLSAAFDVVDRNILLNWLWGVQGLWGLGWRGTCSNGSHPSSAIGCTWCGFRGQNASMTLHMRSVLGLYVLFCLTFIWNFGHGHLLIWDPVSSVYWSYPALYLNVELHRWNCWLIQNGMEAVQDGVQQTLTQSWQNRMAIFHPLEQDLLSWHKGTLFSGSGKLLKAAFDPRPRVDVLLYIWDLCFVLFVLALI